MVLEQVGDLRQLRDERERADLAEQVLQAVDQVQGEPRRRPHRQRDVREHHQPRLVLGAAHRDRRERDAVEAHVAAHRAAGVDPPGRGDAALVREPAVQGVGEPAQRLLQLHPLVLADPVDLRDGPLVRLDDPLLQRQQRLQVTLDRLGQPGEDAGEPAAQRGGVVLGALVLDLALDVVQPAQQRLLLGDRQVGVDLRALLLADLAGRARAGAAGPSRSGRGCPRPGCPGCPWRARSPRSSQPGRSCWPPGGGCTAGRGPRG